MKTVLYISILLFSYIHTSNSQEELQKHYNQAVTAYKDGNHSQFLHHIKKANELRPNHPTLVYNLAAAYALNNQNEKALDIMRKALMMNSKLSFIEDKDFSSLIQNKRFLAFNQLVEELEKPISNSNQIKSINLGTLHPEGIDFDDEKGDFYIGGVYDRRLVKITTNNDFREVVSYKDDESIYSVMGVAIDDKNKIIWICTAALPEMVNYTDEHKGLSSVLAINYSGEVIKSEKIAGKHVFGDLKLMKDGTVLISDTGENKIYKTSLNSDLDLFADLKGHSWNLQGITLNDDESYLYYADYLSGIYRLSMTDKKIEKVELGSKVSPKGIDGIYFYKNSIIAIQNGISPRKTWQLKLNDSGLVIKNAIVIDQALEILNEPTQGVLSDNKFIYIANSPWGLYEKNKLQYGKIQEAKFLEYKIKP